MYVLFSLGRRAETDGQMNEALIADPVRSKQILERIPAGRWGTAEDFEGAIVFLASRASDYVSGECLVVDGGWMGSESLLVCDHSKLTFSRIDLCLSPLVYVSLLGFLCIHSMQHSAALRGHLLACHCVPENQGYIIPTSTSRLTVLLSILFICRTRNPHSIHKQ